MCRGNRQEAIFRDDRDCAVFLDTLGEACGRCGWRIHAFVLMGNHYHLLLETPEANLVVGMKWLQGTYTQRFNARHNVWGHLFQGRYKALLVEADGAYFTTVANYIHLNPARGRCFDLEEGQLSDYRWSSHIGYLRPAKRPEWLTVDRVLGGLDFADDVAGRGRYRQYMRKRVFEVLHSADPQKVDGEWNKIRRGWVFGSDGFRRKMEAAVDIAMDGKRRESFSGEMVNRHDEHEAERLLERGLRVCGLALEDLTNLKKGDDRKKVIAWLIRRNTSIRNEWISKRLKMGHPSSVSRCVRIVEKAEEEEMLDLKNKMSIFKDCPLGPEMDRYNKAANREI
jgi:REP element-mobilizing transposase RayT